MTDVNKVADEADMIVNGYAFTQNKEGCRVLNLNRPDKATVLSKMAKCWKRAWMISKYRL